MSKKFSERSKKKYIRKTDNQIFKKFQKKRNAPDLVSLYLEKKEYQNDQGSCRSAERKKRNER